MEPSKQALDFPATTVAAQHATVLRDGSAAVAAMRRDQLHMELLAYPLIQRIAVVGFIADQSLRRLAEESVSNVSQRRIRPVAISKLPSAILAVHVP